MLLNIKLRNNISHFRMRRKLKKMEGIKFLILLSLLGLTNKAHASTKLSKLITKQSIQNIRLISRDGIFTYFQNRSGSLFLSTNYKLTQIVKGNYEAFYSLHSSPTRKKIIIEADSEYYSGNRLLHNNSLYLINFGDTKLKKIGEGIEPRLHLQDTWISYFNPDTKSIIFQSLKNFSTNFSIKLKNSINKYFIPEAIMINEEDIFFTDLNSKGNSAILLFNRSSQKFIPLLKTEVAGVKIEMCLRPPNLFIGQFGHHDVIYGSEIGKLNIEKSKDFTQIKMLYKSLKNDFGNIECHNNDNLLYFIQDQSPTINSAAVKSELASVHTDTGALKTVSDLGQVTQVVNIDGKILIPFRGEFYIINGEVQVLNDSLKNLDSKKQEIPE